MAIERVKVTGVKFFKGDIDGKGIDSGKAFIEEKLDFTRGTAKGYASQDYSLANAEVARILMANNEFPMIADVEFERVTSGDVSKNIILSVTPAAKSEQFNKPAQKAA